MKSVKMSIAAILFLALVQLSGEFQEIEAQTIDEPTIALIPYVAGLSQPLHITNAGDGSRRLFIVEQEGRIRIVKNGALVTGSFLDITDRVLSGGERGLLSVAFPPGFSTKGYFYVNYTRNFNLEGATVVSRFFLTANPDVANPASEQVLLVIPQPFANHNGGLVVFGPDGFLYIGMGDGGSGGDPFNNGQNPGALLGKMLRIDVESGIAPYAVPTTNPFFQNPGFQPEIWALGLRNPWRFSFDRQTGDLFIADVGQGRVEEVNFQPALSAGGENYGWNIMEGSECFNTLDFFAPLSQCDRAGLTLPVAEYAHGQGDCSVTGGMVYRGPTFSRMAGMYFYGDFCTGKIWGLRRQGDAWQNTLFLDSALTISTFGEDEEGELYAADYGGGAVHLVTDVITVMPVPSRKLTLPYAPVASPVQSVIPGVAMPVGIGPVAEGGAFLRLRISLDQFSGPVDIYAAYELSSDPSIINILNADLSFVPLPLDAAAQALSTGLLPAGIVPWRQGTAGPVNEPLFGLIPLSSLSSGTYRLHILVTPAGSLDNFYLWSSQFTVS